MDGLAPRPDGPVVAEADGRQEDGSVAGRGGEGVVVHA